jgi:biotin carboxylase
MSASAESAETLLVVSASRDALPIIAGARRLGLRVVVCDGTPDAPGFRVADAGLVAPVDDPDSVVEAARAFAAGAPIAGVLAASLEVPCTVAAVADALRLSGPPLAAAAVLADRLRTRRRLRDAGIAVPWSAAAPDVDALCRLAGRRAGPVVVHPVERHAMGALCLGPRVDPAWAFAQAAFASPSGRVMVEDLVQGPQIAVHALLLEGGIRLMVMGDRLLAAASAPFLVEEVIAWPSRDERALERRMEALVAAAAAALGLHRGVLRASVAIGAEGPVLVALATGLGGGYACTHAIPLASGVDLFDAAVRIACGTDVTPAPAGRRGGRGVACRTLFPPSGLVTEIAGVADAAASEGVVAADVLIETGMRVDLATTRRHAAGVVVAVGPTAAAARDRAAAAAARIRIVTRAALVRSPVPAVEPRQTR